MVSASIIEPVVGSNQQLCGLVGRAVASELKGLQFESSHRQTLYYLHAVHFIKKMQINEKRPRIVHILRKEAGTGPKYF